MPTRPLKYASPYPTAVAARTALLEQMRDLGYSALESQYFLSGASLMGCFSPSAPVWRRDHLFRHQLWYAQPSDTHIELAGLADWPGPAARLLSVR